MSCSLPPDKCFPVPKATTQWFTKWLTDNISMVNNGSTLSSGPTFNHLSETEYKKKKTELNSMRLSDIISRSDPSQCVGWQSAARARQPQASIIPQRNKTFKVFHKVKKQVREFICHQKNKKLFEWNIIPPFHAPAQTNDSGLCIVLSKLVSVQLRDSYFDEGISKYQGFSRNKLGGGGEKTWKKC